MKFIAELEKYSIYNNDFDVVNICGSFADKINKNRYNEFSDVDVFIITEKKDYYLNNPQWLDFFNEKYIYFNDPISLGIGCELRVAFENGLLVDIAIVNDMEFRQLKKNSIFCEKIIDRGMLTLKNNKGKNYLEHEKIVSNKINEYDLDRKVDEFWIDIANIYKHLKKGDYFSAKYAFDRRIIKIIIFTMEEYAKIIDNNIDVMFNGRNIKKWLDSESLSLIYNITSSFDNLVMVESIINAINLFESRIYEIRRFYGFTIKSKSKNIVNDIKEKINQLKLIYKVVDILLKYNYGSNEQILKEILINKVDYLYRNKKELNFVIPAFPGKSPNDNSCFSILPDYTEELALKTIKDFMNNVNSCYPFGCSFTIIHDGHFFINLGITRSEVELNSYINEIRKKLPENTESKTIYDLFDSDDCNIALDRFYNEYEKNINDNFDNNAISNEILFTKYEFFDKINDVGISKNQIQMKAKKIALKSLSIKVAISKMINEKYTNSIRLSVHFQNEKSTKMGFKLIPQAINRGTPWFYVAYVSPNGKIILGKKNWNITKKRKKDNNYYLISNKMITMFENNKINIEERKLNR